MIKGLGFDQLFLGQFALGDIGDEPIVTNQFAVLIAARNDGVANPTDMAAFVNEAMVERRGHFAVRHFAGLFDDGGTISRIDHAEPEVRIFIVFLWCIAGDRNAGGAVHRLCGESILEVDGVGVIGNRFEQVAIVMLAFVQGAFGAMTFDGVSDRTNQHVGVDLAFDEIILRASRTALKAMVSSSVPLRTMIGIPAALSVQALESFKAVTVGEGEIGEDDIEVLVAQFGQGIGEAADASPGEMHRLALAEQELKQPRIDGAVFHQ